MRKPTVLVTVFAAVLGAAFSAMGACSSPDSVDPSCTFNVGGNGVTPSMNGCEQFAPCLDDGGNAQPAARCCVDDKGVALTGNPLTSCLYGFGEGAPPSSTSSSSGGDAGDAGDAG